MLKIGALIDNHYKVIGLIGQGGTSSVYLAENLRLNTKVAIKEIYLNGTAVGATSYRTLSAESGLLTKLRHPGLPIIYDIFPGSDTYLIVMEYVEGVSMDKVLQRDKACAQIDVIKWGEQICDVLTYLHGQNPPIIYRDMKPANIILKPDGNIVLIDFGMAREYKYTNRHDTDLLGTHGYAAPEQYSNDKQSDARSDIYSLGVTLYHLVTGCDPCLPPYGINSICSINPSLSPRLDHVIKKCTELDPEKRYQSAREMKADLQMVFSTELTYWDDVPERTSGGNKWIWAVAAVPLLLIIIVAVALSSGGSDDNSDIPAVTDGASQTESAEESGNDGQYTGNGEPVYTRTIPITEPDERIYFPFVPDKSGYYNIYSVSEKGKPAAWIVDEEYNLIDENNIDGQNTWFLIHCWLYEGREYHVETTLYSLDPTVPTTGTYEVCFEYCE